MVEVLEIFKMKNQSADNIEQNSKAASVGGWLNSCNYVQKSVFATDVKGSNSYRVLSSLKNSGMLKTEVGDVIKFRNNAFYVGYHGFKAVSF